MAKIGNVEVPDNLMPTFSVAETPRPSLGSIFGSALGSGIGQIRYGVPLALGVAAGGINPNRQQELQQGLAATDAANTVAPASVSDLTAGKVGLGRFVAENFAASLPQTASILGGGVIGGLAGGAPGALAGSIAVGTPQFVGSNADRAVQENGTLTQGAAVRSLLAAPVQAASDALVERYLPGAEGFLGHAAATQAGNFLSRTAKSIVKAGASEAVAEAGQQLGERAAAGLPLSTPDAAAEYVNAAVTAFAVGGVLGAGGGFRRSDAVTKAPEAVTNDEITQRVDGILDGSLRGPIQPIANPSYQPPRLALPAPEAFAQPVITGADGVSVTPDQQAPAPINLGPQDPTEFLAGQPARLAAARDLASQAEFVGGTADRAREAMRNALQGGVDPSVPDFLRAPAPGIDPQAAVDALSRRGAASPLAIDANGQFNGVNGTVTPSTRPFADQPFADIASVLAQKNAPEDIKAAAQSEIQARRDEAVGDAPLTTDNYKDRLEELKHGLRGGWVQKLDASNPTELVNKVYDEVFENQNTASNVTRFAQRVGLLDEDLNPTEKANQIEAERAAAAQADIASPAAPEAAGAPAAAPAADPDFAAKWQELKSAAGIERTRSGKALFNETPANIDDARQKVIGALANDESKAAVSQTEKVAQQLGLITNDDARDITPLGRRVFLTSPEGAAAVTNAAAENGFTDPQAADAFRQGVAAQLSGQDAGTVNSLSDIGAYHTGKAFAEKFVQHGDVKSAAQTETIRQRQATRQTGTAVEKGSQSSELSPDALRTQAANNLIDAVDLRGVDDSDKAELRRRVREGAGPDEIASAIQQVQRGESLFVQPETTPHTLSPLPVRGGQPTFRDISQEAQSGPRQQSRAASRAETDAAVRAYEVRNAIDYGREQGQITQARADKLHELVDSGNIDQAERLVRIIDAAHNVGRAIDEGGLSGRAQTRAQAAFLDQFNNGGAVENLRYGEPNVPESAHPEDLAKPPMQPVGLASGRGMDSRQADRARKAFWLHKAADAANERVAAPGYGAANSQFEQFLGGKDFSGAAEHMVSHAPSPAIKAVMEGVKTLTSKLGKLGHSFEINIVGPGDPTPIGMRGDTRAYATTSMDPTKPAVTKVFLRSSDSANGGFNYYIAAHEMVHAATMSAMRWARTNDVLRKTALGKAVGDLYDLQDAVRQHLEQRIASNPDDLSPFEQSYRDRGTNVFQDADELVAWGLTNAEAQRYLQSIEYKPRQSVFGRMVQLVRGVLGLDGKYDTALTELMRVSEQIFGASDADLDTVSNNLLYGPKTFAAASLREGAPTASNDATQALVGNLTAAIEKINPQDLKGKGRRLGLGLITENQIQRLYGRAMPGLLKRAEAEGERAAVHGRFEQIGNEASQQFERLKQSSPAMAKNVNRLMEASTKFQLDPDRPFEAHAHLPMSVENGKVTPSKGHEAEISNLRRLHGELVKMKNDLSRGDGAGWKVFQEFRGLNEVQNYARMAAWLHSSIALDPEFSLGIGDAGVNPVETFMRQQGIESTPQLRDYWSKALNSQLSAVDEYLRSKRGELTNNPNATSAEIRRLDQHLSPIEAQVSIIREAIKGMQRAPYFHLGRFGDNFGSAVIRKNADGTVDVNAQRKVAEALEKAGFDGVEISTDNTNPRIAMRFETVDQTMRFKELMKDLHGQGLLDGELADIKAGPRNLADMRAGDVGVAGGLPSYVSRYIQSIEASPTFTPDPGMTAAERVALEEKKQEAVQLARDTWIEMQPDSSISKVLTQRKTVEGNVSDMARSWAQRWSIGSANIAGLSAAPKINAAYVDMRSQVNQATQADSKDDPFKLTDVFSEVKIRDARAPIRPTATVFDKARAFANNYFLGLSPAYGLVNMTQLGVVGLPELAKVHGYSKSFHAMRRASGRAFAVMKAAQSEAIALGPKHWADLTITHDVLKKAGLSSTDRDFLINMIARSAIDIGSAARAQAQIAHGDANSKVDVAFKYASAIGQYTETYSRLLMALAAKDLHGGPVEAATEYANNAVINSMFDYRSWNTARLLGKQGFAGPVTPLLTQFMSYSVQITEKLYSEVLDAASRQRVGETAEAAASRRAGALRFLGGHIAGVTALSGTLGMPFASVFASVAERLFSKSDDPLDATAAWRDFLSNVFGKSAGEVIARGVPRAFGFDVSNRAGEADLLPFTQLLTDRRDFQTSLESYLGRSIGAAPSMLSNIAQGMGKISDGDLLGGLKQALPVAFKGPTEAYRMSSQGYVDTRGNKLPMTPGASDILWQLMGFTPADRAEYSESNADQAARRGVLSRQSAVLRSQIVRALTEGNTDKARELVSQAVEFDKTNPTFAVIPGLSSAVSRRASQTSTAAALGTPIGVSPRDIAGQQLTRYANIDYAQ